MHPGEWPHAWNAPPGAHYDAPVDLLPEDRVGAADVACALRRDRGRLQAVAVLTQSGGGVEDDLVAGRPAPLDREVEVLALHLEADHIGLQQPQRFDQQLFTRLVAVEDGDGGCRHRIE